MAQGQKIKELLSKEAIDGFVTLEKVVARANDQVVKLVKSSETIHLPKNFKEQKEIIGSYKKQLSESEKVTIQLAKAQKQLENVLSEENKQLQITRAERNKANREIRNSTTEYGKLKNELAKAEAEFRELAVAQGLNNEETQEALKRTLELRNRYDDVNKAIKQNLDSTSRYEGIMTDLFPVLGRLNGALDRFSDNQGEIAKGLATQSGFVNGLKKGWANLKGGIASASRALIAFITTPVGAVIALAGALVVSAKALFDYNKNIAPSVRLTQALTGATGELNNKISAGAEALNKTYGTEQKQSIRAMSLLVNKFGKDYDSAFNLINNRLSRGQEFNEEFLNSIEEYSIFFSKAGFSAEEFFSILETGFEEGVFTDKLPDAIKEATISLQEQTKASREALENAFGAEFTDELFGNIENGSVTVKDALFEISEEADKFGLSVQQNAQLTADVFRGAGEDAGGARELFRLLNLSVQKTEAPLSRLSELYNENTERLKRLEEAKRNAFRNDEILAFRDQFKAVWQEIQIGFFKFVEWANELQVQWEIIKQTLIKGIFVFVKELPKLFGDGIKAIKKDFKELFNNIPNFAKSTFIAILKDFKQLVGQFQKGGNVIGLALTGKWKKAQKEFKAFTREFELFPNTLNVLGEEFDNFSSFGVDFFDTFSSSFLTANKSVKKQIEDQIKLRKELESNTSRFKEINEQLESLKALRIQAVDRGDTELAKSLTEQIKALNKELEKYNFNDSVSGGSVGSLTNDDDQTDEILSQIELFDQLSKEQEDIIAKIKEYEELLSRENVSESVIAQINTELKQQEELLEANKKALAEFGREGLADVQPVTGDSLDSIGGIVPDDEIKIEVKAELTKIEPTKAFISEKEKMAERIRESLKELISVDSLAGFGEDLLGQLFENAGIKAEEAKNRRIAALEEEQEINAQLLENGIITQEQFQARERQLENKKEREERAFKIKQAKQEKANALFQIAIRAAAAFFQPFPNPAALIAAGIQSAIVASRPIPKFRTGVTDFEGGLATVGDGGRELVEFPSSRMMLADREVTTYLPKGTNVYTNKQTEKMLSQNEAIQQLKIDQSNQMRQLKSIKKGIWLVAKNTTQNQNNHNSFHDRLSN